MGCVHESTFIIDINNKHDYYNKHTQYQDSNKINITQYHDSSTHVKG